MERVLWNGISCQVRKAKKKATRRCIEEPSPSDFCPDGASAGNFSTLKGYMGRLASWHTRNSTVSLWFELFLPLPRRHRLHDMPPFTARLASSPFYYSFHFPTADWNASTQSTRLGSMLSTLQASSSGIFLWQIPLYAEVPSVSLFDFVCRIGQATKFRIGILFFNSYWHTVATKSSRRLSSSRIISRRISLYFEIPCFQVVLHLISSVELVRWLNQWLECYLLVWHTMEKRK